MNIKRVTLSLALSLLLIATAVFLPVPVAEKANAEGGKDITPPKITGVRMISKSKVFRPGIVYFEVDVIEAETGIQGAGLSFIGDEGNLSGSVSGGYTGTYRVSVNIQSYTPKGEYKLSYISASDRGGNYVIYDSKTELWAQMQNISFSVEDEFDYAPGMFYIDAPGLTQGLKDMEVGGAMRVKVYSDPEFYDDEYDQLPKIIKKEHLDAIKGQDKTIVVDMNTVRWVIKGTDLTGTTKDIRVEVIVNLILKGDILSEIEDDESEVTTFAPENTVLLEFAPNGKLPGKMQVRFKGDLLSSERANVYFLNGENLVYERETDDMVFDGSSKWCYMTVTHNSTFFVSDKKLSKLNKKTTFITHRVYFNLNKGKVAKKIKVLNKTIKKGAKKISMIRVRLGHYYKNGKLPILTRKGYTFLGWYQGSKKIGNIMKIELSKTATNNKITLKAKWKKNKEKGKK